MRTFELVDKKTGEITFSGIEVTESNPCPICGHLHSKQSWCLIDAPRGLVICPRVESDKEIGSAGWMHEIGSSGAEIVTRKVEEKPVKDFTGFAAEAWQRSQKHQRQKLSDMLGLHISTVDDFRVGVHDNSWTFPMWNYEGACIGIRKRGFIGGKWSQKESRSGVFRSRIHDLQNSDWLLICEGETDCMVAHELGFKAIGLPGARQAAKMISRFCLGQKVVIVSDNDEIGIQASMGLRGKLKESGFDVCMIRPPSSFKDLRGWYNQRKIKANALESLVRQKTTWDRPELSSA